MNCHTSPHLSQDTTAATVSQKTTIPIAVRIGLFIVAHMKADIAALSTIIRANQYINSIMVFLVVRVIAASVRERYGIRIAVEELIEIEVFEVYELSRKY